MSSKITAKNISYEMKLKIINNWCGSKNNTIPQISKKYNLPISTVNSVIDAHIKSLKK